MWLVIFVNTIVQLNSLNIDSVHLLLNYYHKQAHTQEWDKQSFIAKLQNY